jgi:hypothetical protein
VVTPRVFEVSPSCPVWLLPRQRLTGQPAYLDIDALRQQLERRSTSWRRCSAAVTQMVVSQAAEVFTAAPEEFGALMARDIVRQGKVVRESGTKRE